MNVNSKKVMSAMIASTMVAGMSVAPLASNSLIIPNVVLVAHAQDVSTDTEATAVEESNAKDDLVEAKGDLTEKDKQETKATTLEPKDGKTDEESNAKDESVEEGDLTEKEGTEWSELTPAEEVKEWSELTPAKEVKEWSELTPAIDEDKLAEEFADYAFTIDIAGSNFEAGATFVSVVVNGEKVATTKERFEFDGRKSMCEIAENLVNYNPQNNTGWGYKVENIEGTKIKITPLSKEKIITQDDTTTYELVGLGGHWPSQPTDTSITFEKGFTNNSGSSHSSHHSHHHHSSSYSSIITNKVSATNPVKSVSKAEAIKNTEKVVKSVVNKAIANGLKEAKASILFKNKAAITPDLLQTIVDTASAEKNAKVDVTVHMDTVVNGKTMARMYINPTLAATLKNPISTIVRTEKTNSNNAETTRVFNKFFKNNIEVVSFEQKGQFGMNISAAVKVDLTDLNTKALKFYSYDTQKNVYKEIKNTNFFIDGNGYLHFNTNVGNSIVITDSTLQSK